MAFAQPAQTSHATAAGSEDNSPVPASLARAGAAPGSIDALVALVTPDMKRVNELILSRTGSDVLMIPEVANHLISSGGKRLRPMVTLAAAGHFGYGGDGHIRLAASVEFMHSATLLHDDVVDDSDMRRGKPAARLVWGNQASVLVGDFLLGQAFKMMVEAGSLECLAILSNAAAVIAEGEVMQLAAAKDLETERETYLQVINAKTAALFAAAAEVGPVIAGASDAERAAFRDFGEYLGLAFQLVDDALDYGGSAGALGKNVGDDFREGKITLPVITAYQAGDAEEKAFWKRCIEDGAIADGDLEHAIALLGRHGALRATIDEALAYGARAKAALAPLADTPLKAALIEVVDFSIARAH